MAESALSEFLAGDDSPQGDPAGDPSGAPATGNKPAPASAATGAPAPADGGIRLGNRFQIFPNRPVPALNGATALAFEARDSRDPSAAAFALVCERDLPPRIDLTQSLRNLDQAWLTVPLDYGIVPWGDPAVHRHAFAFHRPSRGRLVKQPGDRITPLSEERMVRVFLRPALNALKELKARRVFHGSINPLNLFAGDGPESPMRVGECVSAPPGYAQPALYEPIERGMADPAGRGVGSAADDLYALGATIIYLVTGQDPAAGRKGPALTAAKIESGSFKALVDDQRIPLGLNELLRGLLGDDANQRWTLEDIELWLNGRRQSPKLPPPLKRGDRPIQFAGAPCWSAPALAHRMGHRPNDALALIARPDLITWIRRELDDSELADGVASIINGSEGADRSLTLAKVLQILYPAAPIRYARLSIMPDGLGCALAEAASQGGDVQAVARIIESRLPLGWYAHQSASRPETLVAAKAFETVRNLLTRPTIGYGIERCLYQLNDGIACASPMLRGHRVFNLKGLMHVLEMVAAGPDRPRRPFDRHIIAFMLARGGQASDHQLTLLSGSGDPIDQAVAIAEIFANLQARTSIPSLPAMGAWILAIIQPAIQRYRSRTLRRFVVEELERQAKAGDLGNMATILLNERVVRTDAEAHRRAQAEFVAVDRAMRRRRAMASDRDGLVAGVGREVAAAVSGGIGALALLAVVVLSFV